MDDLNHVMETAKIAIHDYLVNSSLGAFSPFMDLYVSGDVASLSDRLYHSLPKESKGLHSDFMSAVMRFASSYVKMDDSSAFDGLLMVVNTCNHISYKTINSAPSQKVSSNNLDLFSYA